MEKFKRFIIKYLLPLTIKGMIAFLEKEDALKNAGYIKCDENCTCNK